MQAAGLLIVSFLGHLSRTVGATLTYKKNEYIYKP